jgi:hypothetical protein
MNKRNKEETSGQAGLAKVTFPFLQEQTVGGVSDSNAV